MVIAFYDPFVYIQYVVPSSFFVVTLLATSCANVGAIKSALPLLASLITTLLTSITRWKQHNQYTRISNSTG